VARHRKFRRRGPLGPLHILEGNKLIAYGSSLNGKDFSNLNQWLINDLMSLLAGEWIMLCIAGHGTGSIQRPDRQGQYRLLLFSLSEMERRFIFDQCPECFGQGQVHCCDGLTASNDLSLDKADNQSTLNE
jgi:hypothetical protein